jgi:acid stress-induced BolA-like protein IbaG/YrbA
MALRILSSPSAPDETAQELRACIVAALPGAQVEVEAASPGHFVIRVASRAFEGESRVRQQQLVYRAIAHLMEGDDAPVHAIDHLKTELP